MATNDQGFVQQSAGQADWDSALNANFDIAERGYHVTGQAGTTIRTGDVLWINSANFMFPFNPNSEDIRPHALAYYAANSGESIRAILTGIVRSLSIHSPVVPGMDAFVSVATPGLVVASYSAASRRIGFGVSEIGLYFNPHGGDTFPQEITATYSTQAIPRSLNHDFSIDVGKRGWVRQFRAIGNSGDLVSLQFYSGSTRASSELLYDTKSGGVSVVGSFIDQAGWPYKNTEASTLSGLIFGRVFIQPAAAVTSDSIAIRLTVDRFR